jgi:hypothetical protein
VLGIRDYSVHCIHSGDGFGAGLPESVKGQDWPVTHQAHLVDSVWPGALWPPRASWRVNKGARRAMGRYPLGRKKKTQSLCHGLTKSLQGFHVNLLLVQLPLDIAHLLLLSRSNCIAFREIPGVGLHLLVQSIGRPE